MKKKEMVTYSPKKDITSYEVARIIDIFEYEKSWLNKDAGLPYLIKRIKEYKLGRHFRFDGIRGK